MRGESDDTLMYEVKSKTNRKNGIRNVLVKLDTSFFQDFSTYLLTIAHTSEIAPDIVPRCS